jgi:hypothetical protein
MFIPQGKPVYENLATSYVLVDALVDDLCEGGFSGVVEIILREIDGHIVIGRGCVAAAVKRRGEGVFERTTVSRLAASARAERGRVSIYSYMGGAAEALAGRFAAEPLYTGLSTDFADLEKMIAKLSREPDRQWFVEVVTSSGATALIQIEGDTCRIITPEGDSEQTGPLDLTGDSRLRSLLDECKSAGGTFDVYYKRAETEEEVALPEPVTPLAASESPQAEPEQMPRPAAEPPAATEPVDERSDAETYTDPEAPLQAEEVAEPAGPDQSVTMVGYEDQASFDLGLGAETRRLFLTISGDEVPDQAGEKPQETSEAEAMAEVKRLMAEVVRTVEEAARASEPLSKFSMYLRAGQLKIADRYPFLDPFGAEFEYLAGEIAFIGKTSPEEFIAGLTEALKLAVVGITQTSAQPARLRAYITEDLRGLATRMRPELERFALDQSIEEIINYKSEDT